MLGAGPVGLLGAMALRARGFETIVYSREKAPNVKAVIAEEIGANYVSSQDVAAAAREELRRDRRGLRGGRRLEARLRGDAALGTNSVFVFTGVPGRKAPITSTPIC